MRIDHIAIHCRDLERTRDFFVRNFEAQPGQLYHNPRTGLRTYFLMFNEGSTRVELMEQRAQSWGIPSFAESRQKSTEVQLMEQRAQSWATPDTLEADTAARGFGYVHLSIAVGSREVVDSLTHRIEADGYPVASPPRLTGDGYYESCILGPDGIRVEIEE